MTLSRIRVALVVLPLAIGCAHAVYDEPNYEDSSQTGELPASAAGASTVNSLPDKGKPTASAGSTGSGSAPGSFDGEDESDRAGATSSAAGSPAGGSPGTAGASTTNGGAATAGSTSGGASAGAASGGSPSAGGTTASAGAPSAGAPSAGAPSAGAPSAGSTGTSCGDIATWTLTPYVAGAKVRAAGKIYQCKPHPFTGWCGVSPVYAPVTGQYWADAWDLIGPC